MGGCIWKVTGFATSASKSAASAASKIYYDISLWEKNFDKEVTVYVWSRRISLLFALHHYIVCEFDDKWRVAEWGASDKYSLDVYSCEKIRGKECCYLGKYKLREVFEAIIKSSSGKQYTSTFNCNHWTNMVAMELGWKLNVKWNCSCNTSKRLLQRYFIPNKREP